MMLDILTIVKPQLYIMDGILGMQGQGPGSGDPVKMDLVLASTDHVAMDIAVCKILGIEPVGIPALKMAKVRGLWPRGLTIRSMDPRMSPIRVSDYQTRPIIS